VCVELASPISWSYSPGRVPSIISATVIPNCRYSCRATAALDPTRGFLFSGETSFRRQLIHCLREFSAQSLKQLVLREPRLRCERIDAVRPECLGEIVGEMGLFGPLPTQELATSLWPLSWNCRSNSLNPPLRMLPAAPPASRPPNPPLSKSPRVPAPDPPTLASAPGWGAGSVARGGRTSISRWTER
jgi:hypothetical protein